MEKKSPSLTDQESPFTIDEVFVSRTDKRGVITAGNEVFARVSGYSYDELVGSPHNIIRHPEMPKAVFKLLWDTIKTGKEIAAYVKNKAADGRYYWVLATVYPIEGGYLSIRMKPTSPVLDTVQALYREVLAVEKAKGLDASFELLVKLVRDAGFASYDDFVLMALRTELGLRDDALMLMPAKYRVRKSQNASDHLFNEMWESAVAAADGLRVSGGRLADLTELREACGTHVKAVGPICEKLESLAVNMFISAHKLGKDGSSLAIVANSFRATTSQVLKCYEKLQTGSAVVLNESGKVGIDIALARVQAEMLLFNLAELAKALQSGTPVSPAEEKRLLGEFDVLLNLVREYFLRHKKQVHAFYETLVALRRACEELHQLMVRLDLIRTGGKLEGSRSNDVTELFRPFVADMASFVKAVDGPVSQLLQNVELVEDSILRMISGTNRMDYVVEEMQFIWQRYRESLPKQRQLQLVA